MALVAYELLDIIGKALSSLSEKLKDGQLSSQESAELFQQILSDLIKAYYN